MKKTTNNNKGFGVIELLVIIIFIGVLVSIVGYTYSGIKANSRNNKREAQLRILQGYIEIFYSHNMYYPTLADMNNPGWLTTNMKGFTSSMVQDPLWTDKNTACTYDQQPTLVLHSQLGCFGYAPTNNGISCAKLAKSCNQYSLSATLENGQKPYVLYQLD